MPSSIVHSVDLWYFSALQMPAQSTTATQITRMHFSVVDEIDWNQN